MYFTPVTILKVLTDAEKARLLVFLHNKIADACDEAEKKWKEVK